MIVTLRFGSVERTDFGCTTRFPHGHEVSSWAHPDDPHYHVIAHRLGYEDDLLRFAFEHDFCHMLVWDALMDAPSGVLHGLATDQPLPAEVAAVEELVVQSFQRYLRAAEQPIVQGVDWGVLRYRAMLLLEGP